MEQLPSIEKIVIVRNVFPLKSKVDIVLPPGRRGQTETHKQTDFATSRLNQPRGPLSENSQPN